MRLILLSLILSFSAQANVRDCKKFQLSIELQVLSKVYFLRTMTADISIKKRKAFLNWDSGHESKKWKIDKEEGLIKIKSKDLKKVFESYEDSTSNARYVQLINFIDEYEDEDDFRFTPMNEAAPFLGNGTYPNPIGEYRVRYSYSSCEE